MIFRYEPNNEPIARDGIHEGLSILIDSHDDWIGSSTVDEDHKGFVGYVSSGVNFPLTAKKGFHILGNLYVHTYTYLLELNFANSKKLNIFLYLYFFNF